MQFPSRPMPFKRGEFGGIDGKASAYYAEDKPGKTQVCSVGWEDPLEKKMATHSSILA